MKKGIKIAFEHEMLLAGLANDMKPKWARLYDEWFSQMADWMDTIKVQSKNT